MGSDKRIFRAYLIGIFCWVLSLLIALKIGSVSAAEMELVIWFRLPRAILASAIGMGLAVAGAALQALFANPLCEPYTLGISSGAALGSVIGLAIGLDLAMAGIAGSAFLGALGFAMILYLVSLRRGVGNLSLLLGGVMLSFFGSSLVALWMAFADPNGIQGAMFWLMGDLSRARLRGAIFALTSAFFLVFMIWTRWRELDALLMGEEEASALGVAVGRVRRRLVLLTSFLIGLCVSGGGMIGFVGLVVPHFVRRMVGSLHLNLIPLCAIWGAVALTLADALARFMARPFELPVGVVTALIGAPVFFWIILRRRQVL